MLSFLKSISEKTSANPYTLLIKVVPEKVYKIEYYRKVYKCVNCDKNGTKANIIAAENKTPACIIKKGLPDASLVADIMQRKYQLGEPLYRQEQYWKLRGIYLNRTSLANWVIKGAAWVDLLSTGSDTMLSLNLFLMLMKLLHGY